MELDVSLHRLAARQYGLVTASQVHRLGFTLKQLRSRVDRGHLERVSQQVLRVAGTTDPMVGRPPRRPGWSGRMVTRA